MSIAPQRDLTSTSYATAPPRAKILILVHSDGHVVAYGQKNVDVKIVNVPHLPGPEGERLTEEYLDSVLPYWARQVFYPGMARCRGNILKITPVDIVERELTLELLRILDGLSTSESEVVIC